MRLVVVALVLACACGGAAPQRKVAVLGVERHSGANDKTFEQWLARHIDRRFDVVGKDALKQVGPIETDDISKRDIRRVAKRVGAAAVVYGEITKKKKGRARLTVWVHDGRTGELIETHEMTVKGGRVAGKRERRFERELLALLPAEQPGGKKRANKPRRESPPAPREEPEREMVAEADESEADDTEAGDPEVETVAEPAPEPKRAKAPAPRPKPAFEPATGAVDTRFDGAGQAIDDEVPEMFVKK